MKKQNGEKNTLVEESDPADKEEFEEIVDETVEEEEAEEVEELQEVHEEEDENLDPDFNSQLDQEVEDWRRKLEQINTNNRNESKIQLPITNDIFMAKLISKPDNPAKTTSKKTHQKPKTLTPTTTQTPKSTTKFVSLQESSQN